jgi:ABC-type oligopeptide transport system substrate-binding subunit
MAAAALASPSAAHDRAKASAASGTLRIEDDSDFDYLDPQLGYVQTTWELEHATQVTLFAFPDKNGEAGKALVPEGAAGNPIISADGKTYTFKIRPGFRFSDGTPVTAQNYAFAMLRALSPKMSSPAAQFLTDIIEGAAAYNVGTASSVSGIATPNGATLVVKLKNQASDLIARLSMPFFAATRTNLPLDPAGVSVYPSAGPYYIVSRTPDRQVVLKPNPYYTGSRPVRFATIDFEIGNSLDTIQYDVETGRSDYAETGLNPTAYATLAQQFGVNKTQFWVFPVLGVSYLALNHDRPLFKNNPQLSKAINWATDRHALVVQGGAFVGKRNDHILPPGMDGYIDKHFYPNSPNFTVAKKLAAGHTRDGKAVLFTTSRTADLNRAAIYQYDLKQIGLDVSVQTFSFATLIRMTELRGASYDLVPLNWIADYPDPYDFVNVQLDGSKLQADNNVNAAFYDNPRYVREMEAAARLTGSARFRAYGQLDVNMIKNDPPWAVRYNFNDRIFVSKRIGCMTFPPGLALVDIAALCFKGS